MAAKWWNAWTRVRKTSTTEFTRTSFGALAPILPGAAAIATVTLYLVDWPDAGNRGLQLAIGLIIGIVLWALASLLVGPELTGVSTASAETYEQLRARVATLDARLAVLDENEHQLPTGRREALAQARALVDTLKTDLALEGHREGASYRWLLGHGYINAWRDLHQAEDVLLAAEPAEVVYATGVANADRLSGPRASTRETLLARELTELVGVDGSDPAHLEAVYRCEDDWARSLVKESAYRIHKTQNDTWDQIVNLRNRLFLTLVLATGLTYAILALAVLQPVDRSVLVAAVAFFLVGAVVGVFNELYQVSRRRKGTVFDYGLANMRLLATPVLSGVAALGGVLISNLAGSFLIAEAGGTPQLDEIFNLSSYGMGLVVAAVFGLTPGLLLDRLRKRTDDYKTEIERLAPTSIAGEKSADGDLAVAA